MSNNNSWWKDEDLPSGGASTRQGGGFGYNNSHPSCRHEPTLICEIQGVKFYGGSCSKMTDPALEKVRADLLINLTGTSIYQKPRKYVTKGGRWLGLNNHFELPEVEEVVIDWPDMQVIPAGREFWKDFFTKIKDAGKRHVVVFCVGGHGRTGTAVASFMTVIKGIHGGEAIRKVREYCRRAIETKVQEDYVRRLTADKRKGGESK